ARGFALTERFSPLVTELITVDPRKLSGPVPNFLRASENPANLKSRGSRPCDIKMSRLPFLAERKKSEPAWIWVVIFSTAFSILSSEGLRSSRCKSLDDQLSHGLNVVICERRREATLCIAAPGGR